jgi:hypothetical protein
MTQGREEADEWVSAYSISYSADAFKWSYVVDGYGNRRVYRGNVDAGSVRYNLLDPPLQTRFVRLHVIEWRGRPSLRLEIVGCQGAQQKVFLFLFFPSFQLSKESKVLLKTITQINNDL